MSSTSEYFRTLPGVRAPASLKRQVEAHGVLVDLPSSSGRTRPGLIEAGPLPVPNQSADELFRGVRAPASLKQELTDRLPLRRGLHSSGAYAPRPHSSHRVPGDLPDDRFVSSGAYAPGLIGATSPI